MRMLSEWKVVVTQHTFGGGRRCHATSHNRNNANKCQWNPFGPQAGIETLRRNHTVGLLMEPSASVDRERKEGKKKRKEKSQTSIPLPLSPRTELSACTNRRDIRSRGRHGGGSVNNYLRSHRRYHTGVEKQTFSLECS